MNYLIMKSIIDATISHFHCKECNTRISERDVMIVGSAGQAVNMEVHCPHCHTIAVIKAEINVMKQPLDMENMVPFGMEVAKVLSVELPVTNDAGSKETIKDEDILALRDRLKGGASAYDIFR